MPKLPDWKVRALNQCETIAFNKIFVKFANNVKPFWDTTQWLLFVGSEPVTQTNIGLSNDTAHIKSPAVQSALMRGDNYTRGYYTVRHIIIFSSFYLI